MKIKLGRLIESFCILPSLNINWMITQVNKNEYKKIYDIQFTWILWYISLNNISKYLKSQGY